MFNFHKYRSNFLDLQISCNTKDGQKTGDLSNPATLGLIGTAALSLATPENFIDWKSFAICIIGLGALVGLLIY